MPNSHKPQETSSDEQPNNGKLWGYLKQSVQLIGQVAISTATTSLINCVFQPEAVIKYFGDRLVRQDTPSICVEPSLPTDVSDSDISEK